MNSRIRFRDLRRYGGLAVLLLWLVLPAVARAGSETPPAGPPWHRDFGEAHREALQTGKPIFVYFTKTYCPHCVVMEKELLANAVLRPAYSQVVWLYVFRDFSKSQSDVAAERISLRFGLTSWPQHILVDPRDLKVLADTGRSESSFFRAVDRATAVVEPTRSLAVAEQIEKATDRAIALETIAVKTKPDVWAARDRLADEDIVVRFRALQVLAETQPDLVARRAQELLAVPNDPFRFEVCDVLARAANVEAAPALHSLVQRPVASRNPNVLRIKAVTALASCGSADSVAVIAPYASSGAYLNGLTGTSVTALVKLAERFPDARSDVRDVLKRSYPQPSENASAIHERYCVKLAKQVHSGLETVTGKTVPFPETFNAATRAQLIAGW